VPICFGEVPTRDVYETGGEPVFDSQLGLHDNSPQRLIVTGSLSTSDEEHYVLLSVDSALVTPDTAGALLRALQTAPTRRYQLPYAGEDDDDFDRSEIRQPEFELLGWLDHFETGWQGLDHHDPLAIENADDRTVPTKDFRALHGLTADPTNTNFYAPTGIAVVSVEIWDDGSSPGQRREVPRSSKGRRTWVRTNSLLAYLAHRNLDLIIVAQAWMYPRSDTRRVSRGANEDHGYEEAHVYLLRQDGSLETINGHRRPWQTDR
jgi:hypothetical protein